MPNPFSKKKPENNPHATGAIVEMVKVTNSVLICDVCWAETSEGEYFTKARRLVYTCPLGHENVVREFDLD